MIGSMMQEANNTGFFFMLVIVVIVGIVVFCLKRMILRREAKKKNVSVKELLEQRKEERRRLKDAKVQKLLETARLATPKIVAERKRNAKIKETIETLACLDGISYPECIASFRSSEISKKDWSMTAVFWAIGVLPCIGFGVLWFVLVSATDKNITYSELPSFIRWASFWGGTYNFALTAVLTGVGMLCCPNKRLKAFKTVLWAIALVRILDLFLL